MARRTISRQADDPWRPSRLISPPIGGPERKLTEHYLHTRYDDNARLLTRGS